MYTVYWLNRFTNLDRTLGDPSSGDLSARELRWRLDGIVLKSVGPIALAAAILYAVLAVVDWLWLPPDIALPLSILCGVTAVALFGLRAALGAWTPSPAAGHPLVVLVGACILINALASQGLTGDHLQSLYVVLLIMGAGVVFLSTPWLAGMIAGCLLGWGLTVLAVDQLPNWGFYLTIMIAAVFLSVTLHSVRLRTISGLIDLREREKRQREELQRSNRDLEAFAYTVSHDLRAPLRSIEGFLGLLESEHADELGEEAKDFLHRAYAGATRMEAMIRDVLTYSQVGGALTDVQPVPVGEVVSEALEQLRSAVESNHAVLTIPGDLPTVEGKATDLVRLFQNLFGNAIKYRDPGRAPAVVLRVERLKDMWRFSVADNGVGIDASALEDVFDLFRRGTGRDDDSGSGVGLAVCRKIVTNHGGRIWVESKPGVGSTFFFTLPAQEVGARSKARPDRT